MQVNGIVFCMRYYVLLFEHQITKTFYFLIMRFKVDSVAAIKTLRPGSQFSLFNKMLLVLTFSDCNKRCDIEHSVLRTAVNFNPCHLPSCIWNKHFQNCLCRRVTYWFPCDLMLVGFIKICQHVWVSCSYQTTLLNSLC